MNDSHDIDMPYHPGCKHRYIEHLDHNALIKRLNEIADEIYRLTQLCVGLQEQLVNHDGSSDAHRSIRESIAAVGTRISTIKVAVDDSLDALDDKVDANYNTLSAADTALANRINNIDSEIEDIQRDLDNISLNLEDGITSTVSGNTPIIKSVASPGDITLAELPSTHGKFKYKAENTKSIITYTANNNSTGVPNYTAVLLDESGNTSFPGTVSAPTFDGNATTATLATKASKLNTSINMMVKDASGENAGPAVTTDLSSDVTLRLPATLKGTDITGTASKATADATGANIADTYVHKVNINEEINGIKTFNNTVKSNVVVPKTSAGSSLGNNNTPYEHIYSTNINGVTATITTITGNLSGNAATATKLTTARAINGTDFDGTTAITTNIWGTARNITIADASATNTGAATSVNGSGNVTLKLPATISATAFNGIASSARKLNSTVRVNGTTFDGSADITTNAWGYSRDFTISNSDGTGTSAVASVDGSSNVALKLPAAIKASLNGNADTATKLKTARTINGTSFDGSASITTEKWGTARNITIADNEGVYTGNTVSVNGSSNITLNLPASIKATLVGHASTATNVTGTVAIANGGTGATTRLGAVKALTNEAVSTPTYFLAITNNWGKAGYTTVAQARSALEVPTKTSQLTNDSGFLTSHQDLSNYVKLTTAQTITGTKTFNSDVKYTSSATRGTAPSSTIYRRPVDYVDSAGNRMFLISTSYGTNMSSFTEIYAYNTTVASGTSIGSIGIGCDANGDVYTKAPTPDTNDNSTKIATTKWVRNQGYITADQDTKVKQNKISDTNTNIYNLLTTRASTSDTTVSETCFAAGVEVWPSFAQFRVTDTYHTDNLKGVAITLDNARYTGGISFYTNDGGDEGAVSTYLGTDGSRHVWLYAANYITDNNISPNGTRTTSGLRLRVGADGGRGVYVQGRWECGLQPYESDTYSLGTYAYKWKRLYVSQIIADNINIDALPTILPTYQYTTSITPNFDASTQTLTLTYTAITIDQYGRVSGYETKRASTRIDISTSAPAITPIQVTTKTLYYEIKGYGGNSPYSKGDVVAAV